MTRTTLKRLTTRPDRSRSTAPTKKERRRENWGPGAQVRPTRLRRYAGPEHLAPSSDHAPRGPWFGAHGGGTPPRKRDRKWRRRRAAYLRRTGWRAFYAQRGAYRRKADQA